MVLAQAGKVTLHTKTYPLADARRPGRLRRRPGPGRAILVPDGRADEAFRLDDDAVGVLEQAGQTFSPCARHSPGRRPRSAPSRSARRPP